MDKWIFCIIPTIFVAILLMLLFLQPPTVSEYEVTGQVVDYTYMPTKFNEYDTITVEFINGTKTTWNVDSVLANSGITIQLGQNYTFYIRNDELHRYSLSESGTRSDNDGQ